MMLRKAVVAGVMAAVLPVTAWASRVDLQLFLGGALVVSETKTGQSLGVTSSKSINGSGGFLQGLVLNTGEVRSRVNVYGTQSANGTVDAVSTPNFNLAPPAGASFAGGKLVLNVTGEAEMIGAGSLTLGLQVEAGTGQWIATGSDSREVANQPGTDSIAFPVTVALPATLDSARQIYVITTLGAQSAANIPGGATAASAEVSLRSANVTSFAVYDAAGVQVTGFVLSGGGRSIPEVVPPVPTLGVAIEYYNATFQHYFVTAAPDEIAKLDAGIIKGWTRTGESFNVYLQAAGDRPAVCRFFSTAFGAKSSHFYAPRGLGCEAVFSDPAWVFEGDVFYTYLPDAEAGACPAGNVPVYRLYNNGQGGAPNHRFTTSEATRALMIAEGWIPEGRGVGVGWCAPQ